MNFIPPQDETRLRAAASGVLPNGKPVIVNSDGTVSVVSASAVLAVGTPGTWSSNNIDLCSSVFDSNSNKVVVAYRDRGNSFYGTAAVGTVSDTSISFGTPVVFESSNVGSKPAITFDSNSNKVVMAYYPGSSYLSTIVGTVSGTSISFGSKTNIAGAYTSWTSATFDSNSNKVIIAWQAQNNSNYGTAIVGTISGTSISYGSAAVFESGSTAAIACTFDSNLNKVVIAYQDVGNSSYGTAAVGTVSDTSISFGTPVVYSATDSHYTSCAFDSNNNKVVITFVDNGNSGSGTSIVGTVSGTSISFGTKVVYYQGSANSDTSTAFDSNLNKIVTLARSTHSVYFGTVSGTSISFDSSADFSAGNAVQTPSIVFDSSSNKIVVSYEDDADSDKGKSTAIQVPSLNLTAENYIGMSGGAVKITGSALVTGSKTAFEQATSRYVSSAYDTNTNRVAIAYADGGNSYHGTAIVGTVSGTGISFGSAVVFEAAEVQDVSVTFDSSSNKIVIAYADEGNSSHGTAIVGTVSGTSISFGTAVVFEAANTDNISATFDSNSNKVVIAYKDLGNSNYGTGIVGTVSGTGISFGTAVVFEQATVGSVKAAFDPSSNKVVIVYQDQGNSNYGTVIIGTVSGTGISFGTAVVFLAANAPSTGVPVIDTDNNKVIISYKDNGNSNYGTARVGTVSGTSISFGTAVVFNSGNTELYAGQAYHPNIQRAVLGYRDDGDSNIGKYNVGTVSGTDISFTGEVAFNSGRADNLSLIYDPDSENLVMSFEDQANSSYGTSLVFSPSTLVTNRGQVAAGSSASVDIIGTVSENQSELTAGQSYFVQTDGTIALTADDPSVFAGTAISATKLLVKT